MPVYVRAEALEVPPPSNIDCSEVPDPDPDDVFPEKTGPEGAAERALSEVFNNCWDELDKKKAAQGQLILLFHQFFIKNINMNLINNFINLI